MRTETAYVGVTIAAFDEHDAPEWCEHCLLPSVNVADVFLEYSGLAHGFEVKQFRACTECGRQEMQ